MKYSTDHSDQDISLTKIFLYNTSAFGIIGAVIGVFFSFIFNYYILFTGNESLYALIFPPQEIQQTITPSPVKGAFQYFGSILLPTFAVFGGVIGIIIGILFVTCAVILKHFRKTNT